MMCHFSDIRCKEVISIKSGCRIGFVDDIEIDSCTAKICRIIVYGKSRCFGIFGREEDIFINWSDIEIIGEDTILVGCDFPHLTMEQEPAEYRQQSLLPYTSLPEV